MDDVVTGAVESEYVAEHDSQSPQGIPFGVPPVGVATVNSYSESQTLVGPLYQ